MKVLFVASECVPFVKTGGLADVVGALPIALRESGADIRVMLPKYGIIDEYWKSRMRQLCHFEVQFGWEKVYCGVETLEDNGVIYYFIDNESFFYVGDIYGDGFYEALRFAFFCRAVLEALPKDRFLSDILHLNDWQTGMIPALLKTQYLGSADYACIRTVFSIHNLKFQGLFSWNDLAGRLGLDARYFTPEYLEFYGCLSFMKGGLVFADRISTVSPTYAGEIKTPTLAKISTGFCVCAKARSAAFSTASTIRFLTPRPTGYYRIITTRRIRKASRSASAPCRRSAALRSGMFL